MKVFIISWRDQHENANYIVETISKVSEDITIVFSDPDQNFTFNNPFNAIRRPNNLFWEDKFKSCIDASGDRGVLIIHADCFCDNWEFLVKRCKDIIQKNKDIGVWAPEIEGTHCNLSASGIVKIRDSSLVLSALTDGIVFYISPFIINRMRQINYGKNKFGWGIDGLFCSSSHVNNKLVVIDTSIKVFHNSKIRGYDGKLAQSDKNSFLKQFLPRELVEYKLLRAYVLYNHNRLLALANKSNLNNI